MPSRRGHGEGSIYRRESDGRWCAGVDLGWVNGKRKRKMLYGATRKEVAEKLKIALREQQQGLPVASDRQSVAAYLEHYIASVVAIQGKPSTLASYRGTAKRYLVPAFGHRPLAKLAPSDVEALHAAMRARGLALRTIRGAHTLLHGALSHAVRQNLIPRNVCDVVASPTPTRATISPLDAAQIRQLLDAASGDRFAALYHVALTTGMRLGELLGLRWRDVDLERGSLAVRQQINRMVGQGSVASAPKGKRGRGIPLPASTVEALRGHKRRQAEDRLRAGSAWRDHDLVFASLVGTPLAAQSVYRRFKPLLVRAGVPDIRFHDLRHSAATWLLTLEIHPKVVQERLGHATIAITLDTYSHVLPDIQRGAAEALETALTRPA